MGKANTESGDKIMAKVIIAVIDGEVSIVEQPDYVAVEVRDYVVVDDHETYPDLHTDDNGDYYRVISFPAPMPPQAEQFEFTVRSYYKHCGQEWDADWNCACDDECPVCRKAISPYRHEDIE